MSSERPRTSRKRLLSGDEKLLWHAVAKSTKPLRRKKPVIELDEADAIAPAATPVRALRKPSREAVAQPVAKPVQRPLISLDRRERSRIAKGRTSIDARLDLHGMTQARAHHALVAFLHRAHADGAAVVLVITGKGQPSATGDARGVLRRQLPLWLALPDLRNLVLGFDAAHASHGGDGAFYVRLRKLR